jgi:hypothetical protein
MDYELTAIVRAARSVHIQLVEGRYHMLVYDQAGVEHIFVNVDLPALIHDVHDSIML